MKIEDLFLYIPRNFFASFTKLYRENVDEKVKDKIIKEGMYHFVPNEEVAKKILESEYLKPATGSMKYINSYGTPVACLFCGIPELDNYCKNLVGYNIKNNPYVNPAQIKTAVKILPENKEDLKNYKIRNLADDAILYEGYCVLPHKSITIEKMVSDLVRDENGNPIKDINGEYQVEIRKVRDEELIEGSELYRAKDDYLEYMKEKAIELGYSKNDVKVISSVINNVNSVIHQPMMEYDVSKKTFNKNIGGILNNIFLKIKETIKKMTTPQLEDSTENIIQDFKFGLKNPYQDKKFGVFIAEIQSKQGLEQLSLETVLKQLNQSKEGEYLTNKYKDIEDNLNGSKKHGKAHADRVLINSMIIAKREGVLENDFDNRIKDILITAAAYHDIGRVLDSGPHAGRSVRKINKMDLKFSDGTNYSKEDKKLLMAIVESHEGKPEKIDKMIKKYDIKNIEDIKVARALNLVLRDADALDRVRLDKVTVTNTKTNLNPRYLKTNTAKQLVKEAYELENLSEKKTMQSILKYGKKTEAEKFSEQYQVEASELIPIELKQETVDLSKKINSKTKQQDNYIQE